MASKDREACHDTVRYFELKVSEMEEYGTHLSFQHAVHNLKDIAKLTLPAREVPHA